MPAKRVFTDNENKDIKARYKRRESINSITKEHKGTDRSIKEALLKMEVEIRSIKERSIKRVFTDVEIEDMKTRYNKQESLKTIMKVYKASQGAITRSLEKNGIEIRPKCEKKDFKKIDEIEIMKRYKNLESINSISKSYKCSRKCITSLLKENGLEIRGVIESRKIIFTIEQKKQIEKAYKEGEHAIQIAKNYGVTSHTIKNILVELKVAIRSNSEAKGGLNDSQKQEIMNFYNQGLNTVELAKKYGVCNATVGLYLVELGVQKRTQTEATGGLNEEQKKEIVARYQNGESTYDIAKDTGVRAITISNYIKASSNRLRTPSESRTLKFESLLDAEDIVNRYEKGESSHLIAEDYSLSAKAILSFLRRRKIEIRDRTGWGDSVRHILDGTGNYHSQRETEFYVFTIKGYPGILKPGISKDADFRKKYGSSGYYENEILLQVYETREEAFFVEQAILNQTANFGSRPEELVSIDWQGISELRCIEEEELNSIFEFLHSELENMGVWKFATVYVPMTKREKKECLIRSLSE